jgi:hypothetical protein
MFQKKRGDMAAENNPPQQQGEIPASAFEDGAPEHERTIPRFLQLARAIHARFSAEEDKARAVFKQAEELASRKNEVIMRSVNEVLRFCELLRKMPELNDALDRKTEDITQRLFNDRSTYTMEDETIAVKYKAPFYQVDMHVPEHISLSCANDAYLHISFNPVKFVVVRSDSEENSTITKHLLMKQYRLDANGTFLHFKDNDGAAADPIADIITELREKIGREFFEMHLMPFLEKEAEALQTVY